MDRRLLSGLTLNFLYKGLCGTQFTYLKKIISKITSEPYNYPRTLKYEVAYKQLEIIQIETDITF